MLAADGSQICPTYKLTAAAMDAFLLENTGLTLAQTNKVIWTRLTTCRTMTPTI